MASGPDPDPHGSALVLLSWIQSWIRNRNRIPITNETDKTWQVAMINNHPTYFCIFLDMTMFKNLLNYRYLLPIKKEL